MVYAVWAIRRSFALEQPELTQEIYRAFRQSMEYSLVHIDQVSQNAARWETLSADLLNSILPALNLILTQEQAGLKEFYLRANRNGFLAKIPKLEFIDTQNSQTEG